ncbi:MAG: extracellular solute-binding protein [Limnochordia bacterium]|nr:extracellular solute-binding protein [Limnochordia bacterium]
MHSRRTICFVLVLVLAMIAGTVYSQEPIVLEHMVWQFMFGEDIEFLEELADEFMALNPDIEIRLEIQRNVVDALTVRTAAGIPPDVIAISSFDALQFALKGILLDLTELMENDPDFHEDAFIPGMLQSYTYEGESVLRYGMPYQVLTWTASYNKSHFDEAAIPYPEEGPKWTWETARELGRKLTQRTPEGSTKQYGLVIDGSKRVDWAYWMALTHQAGGGIFDKIVGPSSSNFQSQAARDAIDYLMSLYDEGVAPLWVSEPGNIGISYNNVSISLHDIPSTIDNYKITLGKSASVGHIRQPMGPVQDGWFSDGQGFAIHSQSKNMDAAWEWVKFLTLRKESGEKLVDDRSRINALRENLTYYAEHSDLFTIQAVLDAVSNPNNVPRFVVTDPRFWSQVVNIQMQHVATKQTGLEAALAEIDRLSGGFLAH